MTDAPFRWGLLGAARIARALIPAIREAGGEVTGVAVRDPQSARAQAFSQEWNVPVLGTYDDLIGADLDAVYNPLPNDAHLPWTLAALNAGKHVLTEKPLTLNAAQAAQLAEAAARSGRTLLEAFAYRFQPQIDRVRQIAAEELGDLRAVHGAFGFHLTNPDDFRWNAAQGGGALYDVGTYPVNLIRLLLGEPHAVTATARWTDGGPAGGVDIALSGVLEYGGALASLDCAFDWLEPAPQRLTVVGSRGTLDVNGVFNSHTHEPVTLHVTAGGRTWEDSVAPGNGYARMVAHFQRTARGQEPPLYPPQDAEAQMRVLDALYASARSGQRVTLTTSPRPA
ncbi:Gfo/Idh/MocA family oxidoreductase [Deinococcus taeanensis]|uniref:Gfo/Idh/MocA family protein n=1 Tax=Deinococcus taeanensis TaxID=2737050 RepID=UPI001CDC9B2F|nr:Gfo/Idh/MocA family oxidoreductase [Deinococcus taeanensis]UBV42038.1 Gfo/Idh/MocA family oxidoreductase [Deinococcus taeanensis]